MPPTFDPSRWYHCVFNTYGTWLPGDPRGFRTRHHREHVDGDYKRPPAEGTWTRRLERSQRLTGEAVFLTAGQRDLARDQIVTTLVAYKQVPLEALAVGGAHAHLLFRVPAGLKLPPQEHSAPRHLVGLAKQWSAKRIKQETHRPVPHLWAKRGKIKPIRDASHFRNTAAYILRHREEGAATWRANDPLPVPAPKH